MKTRTGNLLTAAVLAAASMSALVMGCELISSVDRSMIGASGGAGGGGGGSPSTTTGGETTSSASSSSTGGIACTDPVKDCPAPANECVTAICDANKLCAVSNVADGGPVTAQTAGDCKTLVCDGKGATKAIDDNADTNDDAKECTTDTCAAGAPVHTPLAVNTACGAAGGKTKCDAMGNCVGCIDISDCGTPPACKVATCNAGICGTVDAADATACSDDNGCTQTDTCLAGACVGSNPVVCNALDQCHNAGTCTPITGTCSISLPKGNGAGCNDGDLCTQTDSCSAGICVGSSPVVCPTPDQCHDVAACDSATGMCAITSKANGTACADTNLCTTMDTCQAGTCTAGTPTVCMALDECHDVGSCTLATGVCSNPNKADGSLCAGGAKSCLAGVCQ